jgi:GT2 family glycosyltransferase
MKNKPLKFIVAIPTLNRADLLNEALAKYFEDFPNTHIAICDNGNQDIITRENNFMIYRPESNLGVSDGWNMLMDYADRIDATHVFMLNDDVYSGAKENDINGILRAFPYTPFINSLQNWCSFILSVDAWKKVGSFDGVNFPNYFNDNDYCFRMQLLGLKRLNASFLNPAIYRNSMTIAKDPSLNNNFSLYQKRYIEKWGGLPSQERFRTPFNQ